MNEKDTFLMIVFIKRSVIFSIYECVIRFSYKYLYLLLKNKTHA